MKEHVKNLVMCCSTAVGAIFLYVSLCALDPVTKPPATKPPRLVQHRERVFNQTHVIGNVVEYEGQLYLMNNSGGIVKLGAAE